MLGDSTSEEIDGPKKSARSCYRAAYMNARLHHLRRPPLHVSGTRESRGYPMHGEPQSVRTIYRQTECFRNADNNLRDWARSMAAPAFGQIC